MKRYRSNPTTVLAFKLVDHKAPLPEPFASYQGQTPMSGTQKIGKNAVGELLVPAGGAIVTCRFGDYLVQREDGSLDVIAPKVFEANFTEIEGEAAPASAAETTPAADEAPAA